MRISRQCYDKRRRCPGWAGGGMKYAKVQRCDNGYIDWEGAGWFTMRQCPKCGVWVLPTAFAVMAPNNIWFTIKMSFRYTIPEIRHNGFLFWLRYGSPLPHKLRMLVKKEWT